MRQWFEDYGMAVVYGVVGSGLLGVFIKIIMEVSG